eukprot:gene7247-8055_t
MDRSNLNCCYILLLVTLSSITMVESGCFISEGMKFRQFQSVALNAMPIETIQIWREIECQMECHANSKCNSINIKAATHGLICELLSLNSKSATTIANSNSTYYEFENTFKARDAFNIECITIIITTKGENDVFYKKTYCEPECQYFGQCTNNAHMPWFANCRCDQGSIQPLFKRTVLVGAKNSAFASLTVQVSTGRYKIKLVYVNGFVSCVPNYVTYYTHFGCKLSTKDEIEMIVTQKDNTVMLPGNQGVTHDGQKSRSTFVTYNDPVDLTYGQQLRIWHREDLHNSYEADNAGSVFMYVLAIKQE